MIQYNFDEVVDRRDTESIALEGQEKLFGSSGLLPLWVADMGFRTPDFIIKALRKRLEHPIFGYTQIPNDYWSTIARWIFDHHGWDVPLEWMIFIPGIVKGIGFAVNVFTKPDEKVIIQPPVYHPFRLVPIANRRKVVYNPLVENTDGSYSMDFDGLTKVWDEKCRLLILSNPHNPGGILWDKATLQKLAHFAVEHNLIVISDEIHCDMALWGLRHTPFASVSEEAAQCSITFGAPSKTFNIAGIVCSYAIVPNEQIRKSFFSWLSANEIDFPSIFPIVASMAAFKCGEPWRKQMIAYLEKNVMFVEDFLRKKIPQIKFVRPQASFLIWLDCRGLGLSHDQLTDLFYRQAKVAVNDGLMFGQEGSGFMRLNIGYPRKVIEQALQQLADSIGATLQI